MDLSSEKDARPPDVAHMLAASGVRCAALTDHDTSKGLLRFREALYRHDIEVVSGIELTASHPLGEVHLLALGFPFTGSNPFEDSLRAGPRFRSGYFPFMRGGNSAPPERAESLIQRAHRMGAVVFLAHPLQPNGDYARLEHLLHDLRLAGLDGIEAFYKPYPQEERERLAALADRYDLLVTAGSDFHGDGVLGSPEPGCAMPWGHWERFRRALSIPLQDPIGTEDNP